MMTLQTLRFQDRAGRAQPSGAIRGSSKPELPCLNRTTNCWRPRRGRNDVAAAGCPFAGQPIAWEHP